MTAHLGEAGEDQAIDRLIDHIEILIERLGAGHVGIGTDLQAGWRKSLLRWP